MPSLEAVGMDPVASRSELPENPRRGTPGQDPERGCELARLLSSPHAHLLLLSGAGMLRLEQAMNALELDPSMK